jgi:hypothetical protein
MTQKALSLMDVLAPPGNLWLAEISRRKTGLPAGVHSVRFGDGDEDSREGGDDDDLASKASTAVPA